MKKINSFLVVLLLMLTSLTASAQYLRGDVDQDGRVNIDDVTCLIDFLLNGLWPDEPVTPPDDHEWVDLGLPSGTLWATCNVGANSPEEFGDYFAWGETEPKENYNWTTYKWCNGSGTTLKKYCTKSNYGTVDDKTELDLEDDAAYVNWGPSWRMPSKAQLDELDNCCTWTWTTMNGVNGRLVTGPNGNTLFLPATGCHYGGKLTNVGVHGYYWSYTLYSGYPGYAYYLDLSSEYVDWVYHYRYYGYAVRAVCVSPAAGQDLYIEQNNLDLGEAPIGETLTGTLTIVNNSQDVVTLTAAADVPFSFKQDGHGASSITVVVPGNSTNTVIVMFTATTPGEYNGNVTFENSALTGGQSVIPVHARSISKDFPQHDYVDLGLPSGTLWATCNVGASSSEAYGDYFAWGETETKEVYDWNSYKWCNGTNTTLTKYCTNSINGTVDGTADLDLADDAAYTNWGPSWRMPTKDQMYELKRKCNWKKAKKSGVDGYLVTGPNGNKIFLPNAGYRDGASLVNTGYYFSYCSRTLNSTNPETAYCLNYDSESVEFTSIPRYAGYTVRAVCVSPADLYIEQHSLDLDDVPIGARRTGELTIVNNTQEAMTLTVTADAPFLLKQGVNSASSITVVVPGYSRETVTVMFTATTLGEFNGNVTFLNSALYEGQSVIPVHSCAISSEFLQHEYVDLGLSSGTLWATCNVGASSPEEYGDYFAWGEIEPKYHYDWSTYKWCNGSSNTFTKYCTDSEYGTVDNKTTLDLEDDAAYMNWGPSWCMPSQNQIKELVNQCTLEKATLNGVKGWLVTGPNLNTIFLPGAGHWPRITGNSYYGDYWTCTLDPSWPVCANYLFFNGESVSTTGGVGRNVGNTVRAVRVKHN